jgi:Tfp pilus assembly protein PilF
MKVKIEETLHQSDLTKTIFTAIGILITMSIIVVVSVSCNSLPTSPATDSAEAYLNRGLEYYSKGDLKHAISEYDKAI